MKQKLLVRVRFGPFELNVRSGELHYEGKTTLLQQQSFRLLLALIEQDGEVVTREDLQKRLWPNDTVVEFDLGINAAIKRLRRVLSDSPEQPKYIETVARRGYRLMVPVVWLPSSPRDTGANTDKGRGSGPVGLVTFGLVGQEVSHYRILEVLGEGGMGVIYKAEDLRLRRFAALKFLPEDFSADARALSGLEQEACLASSLNHPNICSVYELGTHQGQPFIAMELLAGATLRDSFGLDVPGGATPPRPVPLDKLLDIAIQVCEGLKAAHQKGIIHRDVKPANLFITSTAVVKILDFGLAKLMYSDADEGQGRQPDETAAASPSWPVVAKTSHTAIAIGTAAYMSPEQIRGEPLDARTDLFSLGVVLYQMATGISPFQGESPAVLFDAILHTTPATPDALNPAVPLELERIIHRALEKDRDRRYQSAAEMEADLRFLAGETASSGSAAIRGRSGDRTRPATRGHKLLSWRVAVLVVLLAAAIGGGLYWQWRLRKSAALGAKGTLVVSDFDNTTGDRVFDGTLRKGLSMALKQSPFLTLLPDQRIAETLALMGRSKKAQLTAEVAREVCIRSGSAGTIEGFIGLLGKQYVIGLRAVNCQSGEEIAVQQLTVDSKEKVLPALGKIASQIRRDLGESLVSVQQHSGPLQPVTTSSLEALKAYSRGVRADDEGDFPAAIALFQRAIDLDPNFTSAYMALGAMYGSMGLNDRASQNFRKAYEQRDRVSEREKIEIVARYADSVTGDVETARKAYKTWMQVYPDKLDARTSLAIDDTILGHYEDALSLFQEIAQSYPDSPLSYANLCVAYMYLNRLDQAKETARVVQARHINAPAMHLLLYEVGFLQHDVATMQREAAALMGKLGWEDQIFDLESDTAAYAGQFSQARKLTEQAVDSATRASEKEAAAAYKAEAAVREALVGNVAMAKQQALAALALSNSKDAAAISAVALGLSGEASKATGLADKLAERYPEDTIMLFNYLPTIRAAIALSSGRPSKALSDLAPAAAYEFGSIQGSTNFMLYPVYLRGEAYLAARQGIAAATEFQKILDHPGIVLNEPISALAHLGMARAYASSGDTARAKVAYQDFLTLWKDADPDIPIYRQAKAEYVKLSNSGE